MTYGLEVTFIHQDYLAPGLATFLLVLMCYIAGRVHQFFKQTQEREQAYREGYNQATRALFSLATRAAKPSPKAAAEPVKMRTGYASVPLDARSPLPARHRAGGRRQPSTADTKRYADWPDLKQAA